MMCSIFEEAGAPLPEEAQKGCWDIEKRVLDLGLPAADVIDGIALSQSWLTSYFKNKVNEDTKSP